MFKSLVILLIMALMVGWKAQDHSTEDRVPVVWAEAMITQLPDRIKLVREPSARIFLRIRLATFLWKNRPKFLDSPELLAHNLAKDCIKDLQAYNDDLPETYRTQFGRELNTLLNLNAPVLLEELKRQDSQRTNNKTDAFLVARGLIDKPDGGLRAIEIAEQALREGSNPSASLFFFFKQVKEHLPKEIPRLVSAVLSAETAHPGSLSLNTLFWLQQFALSDDTSADLKARFLTVAVAVFERSQDVADPARIQAYNFLSTLIPTIQLLAPALHSRTNALLASFLGRMTPTSQDRVAMERRLRDSPDRFNQLLVEAQSAKNETLKNDLLMEAAELALTKRQQLRRSLELALSVPSDGEVGQRREQFLRDLVTQALKEKDLQLAIEIASKITANSDRASAFQTLAVYFLGAQDLVLARQYLGEAAKSMQSEEDSIDKARMFFALATSSMKVDPLRVNELFRSGLKVVNAISTPVDNDKNKEPRIRSTQAFLQSAWNLQPAFQQLVGFDFTIASSLLGEIENSDLRLVGLLGASTGVLEKAKKAASSAQNK